MPNVTEIIQRLCATSAEVEERIEVKLNEPADCDIVVGHSVSFKFIHIALIHLFLSEF